MVAEQFLDDGKVVAVGEQHCGEGVSGYMGREVFADVGKSGYGLQVFVDHSGGGADCPCGHLSVGGGTWREMLEIAEYKIMGNVAWVRLLGEGSAFGEYLPDIFLQGDA